MTERMLATAADYADAMLIARRAKNLLFWVLLLFLLAQLTVFFLYRYEVVGIAAPQQQVEVNDAPAPSVANALMHYVTAGINFLGVILVILLALILLLMVNIMLVGRLIGVAKVTSAYLWALLLALLLFPWQAFLGEYDYGFRLPGVLYTWSELIEFGRWTQVSVQEAMLKWARFVGFPLLAVAILIAVQTKSSRGLRQALGEEAPPTTS